MATEDSAFYKWWILANGWAEAAGLGTTFVLGRESAPWISETTGKAAILGGALLAVALGALLEGVLIGAAQESVLRSRLPEIKKGSWIFATAVGAGLAWALGMIPSTLMATSAPEAAAASTPEPPLLVQYGLAVVLGLLAGPILGVAQWTVLRRHVSRPARWLWANALAWAIGMPLIFIGMDRVPWTASRFPVALLPYGICGAVGLVVGAVHGEFWYNCSIQPRGGLDGTGDREAGS
jgi:hypothetical protein